MVQIFVLLGREVRSLCLRLLLGLGLVVYLDLYFEILAGILDGIRYGHLRLWLCFIGSKIDDFRLLVEGANSSIR